MSAFPTTTFNGKTVFMEAENRNRMSLGGPGDNSDVLMHVFPSEAIGLGSDPNLLAIARNTVAALNPDDRRASWFQANCFPKIYTQAVRSGYPADKVMENLKRLLSGEQPYDDRGDHVRLRDNLTIVPPMHGLENVGAIEAVNSMLLQSHDDVLRLFPVWIKGRDASFRICGPTVPSLSVVNTGMAESPISTSLAKRAGCARSRIPGPAKRAQLSRPPLRWGGNRPGTIKARPGRIPPQRDGLRSTAPSSAI